MKTWTKTVCLTLCAGLLVGGAAAGLRADPTDDLKKQAQEAAKKQMDEQMKKLQPAGDKKPADGAGGMKPEDMAMMQEMMKLSMPTEQHKIIQNFAGTWNAEVKMWMDPSQKEPNVSNGVMKGTLLHGGRFLLAEFTSNFMGMDFTGTMTWGYNTIQKRYESTWFDSFGTYMLISQGQPSADGKTVTSTAQFSMPGPDGKLMDISQREKLVWVSADKYTMEMWHATKDQGEMKVMEITYTRAPEAKPAAAAPAVPAKPTTPSMPAVPTKPANH